MTSPLWRCPRCGRTFAARNQTHTSAPLGDLDRHFAGSDAEVGAAFDRVVESPRFTRVEEFSPHNVLHAFRLHGPEEVDDEVADWLAAAYRVGEQRHRKPDRQ